jgi:multidrug efflux pump subunit AcrA (membrane-fusion protein)
MVPNSAVRDRNGSKTVQILRDGKQISQKVKTGMNNDEMVEIVEGLQEGEMVIVGALRQTPSKSSGGIMPVRIR